MDGGRGDTAWADAGAILDRAIEATRASWSGSGSAEGEASTDPAAFLGQAALIAFSSGLRYWSDLAAVCAARGDVLARGLLVGGKPLIEAEQRQVIEATRALAREVGDLAVREARRLQADLNDLALRLAATAPEPLTPPGSRRYARAKP